LFKDAQKKEKLPLKEKYLLVHRNNAYF